MSDYMPRFRIGDAVYFRYVPYDQINPTTSEVIVQTPEVPATIISIAHNFNHEIEISPEALMPRTMRTDWIGFFYFVELDQEEAAALGITLTYSKGAPLTTEVIRENQITGKRIAF